MPLTNALASTQHYLCNILVKMFNPNLIMRGENTRLVYTNPASLDFKMLMP